MRILHQFKLMTSNGFVILLILIERIKRDIVQNLRRSSTTTGRIETTEEQMNCYDNEGREIFNEPP